MRSVALIMLLALTGCYSEKKAVRQVVKANATYPHITAGLCGQWYDPTDSVWERETIVPGETQWRYDTVTANCDTVRISTNGTRTVRIACPPCPVRVDTIIKTRYQQQVNRAKETALEDKVSKQEVTIAKTKQGRNTWRMIAIILAAGWVLYLVRKIFFK